MTTKNNPYNETGIYKAGKAFVDLGAVMMDDQSTIGDIAGAAYEAGMEFRFCLVPTPDEKNLSESEE